MERDGFMSEKYRKPPMKRGGHGPMGAGEKAKDFKFLEGKLKPAGIFKRIGHNRPAYISELMPQRIVCGRFGIYIICIYIISI